MAIPKKMEFKFEQGPGGKNELLSLKISTI